MIVIQLEFSTAVSTPKTCSVITPICDHVLKYQEKLNLHQPIYIKCVANIGAGISLNL